MTEDHASRHQADAPESPEGDDASESPKGDVVLVSMPWNNVDCPSIQLGILAPLIARAGLSVRTLLLNLTFFDHVVTTLGADRFPPAEYTWIGNDLGLGRVAVRRPPVHEQGRRPLP